jgi:hypothetical protein
MVWNVKVTETGFEGTQLLLGNPPLQAGAVVDPG